MGDVYIGTSGFSFDDWRGNVYPKNIKSYEMLPFYERELGFNTLEVNYTYYTLPSQKTMESFYKRTSDSFTFVVKGYKGITHTRDESFKRFCTAFKDGLKPLGNRLKAILFQFPYAFSPKDENIRHLEAIREEFNGCESVIEFRNERWLKDNYIDLLRDMSMGLCIVDEPKIKGLMPYYPAITSRIGYFRFHGRNENWFNAPSEVRYDYLYSEEEIRGFIPSIKDISRKADTTFVYFNNCHLGKAVKNAQRLKELLAED